MALNGAVDSPHKGGVPAYRKAFFSPAFLEANPTESDLVEELRISIDLHVRRSCPVGALDLPRLTPSPPAPLTGPRHPPLPDGPRRALPRVDVPVPHDDPAVCVDPRHGSAVGHSD